MATRLRHCRRGIAGLAGAAVVLHAGAPHTGLQPAERLGRHQHRHLDTATPPPPGQPALLLQLVLDLLMLTLLLAISGGPANPLTALYLPPIAIAAAVLPARHTGLVTLLGILAYSSLWKFSLPLTVEDVDRAMQMHLTGMWLTFAASAILIAAFVSRITAALREREHQLAAAREQALRDERIFALGNLAAGAAHELGTPLATMAVIAGELAHERSLPEALHADVQLLGTQIAACKDIISGLAERAGLTRAEGGRAMPLDQWLEQLIARWCSLRPQIHPELVFEPTRAAAEPAPRIFAEITLEQALLNLFNNAADASPAAVSIHIRWDSEQLELDILDRGPGMDAARLQQAGREVFSSRNDGAGIGLLLAHAALNRYGGSITMAARKDGQNGLCVRATLPLHTLLATAPAS